LGMNRPKNSALFKRNRWLDSQRRNRFDSLRDFDSKPKSKIVKVQMRRSAVISLIGSSSLTCTAIALAWDFLLSLAR
jgi:hypothetical protein